MNSTSESPTSHQPDRAARTLRIVLALVLGIIAVLGAWLAAAYSMTPPGIRHPQNAHYHFRLQIIKDGAPVNFAKNAYQTEFNKDICSAALTKEPFHFHDNLDQFVHVHWDHMTGGLLLKHYGWNLIGGTDSTLGYDFTKFPRIARVPVHGQALPEPSAGTKYYIYTGNADSHQERNWNDFLQQDLRDFFAGKKMVTLMNRVAPAAYAHGSQGSDHGSGRENDEQLAKLNDVLGSVVIFAQKNRPSDQQIKDRFSALVPLPESTCGG